MIYMDNAATSWPKPQCVIEAMENCLVNFCANPGRSGHEMALKSGRVVYDCRCLVADMFGLYSPENVIFTQNATQALNIVIKGLLDHTSHTVITSMEHNSVLRPVASSGAMYDVVEADGYGYVKSEDVEKFIKPNTSLIICTLSSNVCGSVQPYEEIALVAKKHNIPFLLDASQGAGNISVNMTKSQIDFLAAPGHKGLLGPTGTGVLCINSSARLKSFMEGGTGSDSKLIIQPEYLPDRFESGTVNVVGIAGLKAGIEYIKKLGTDYIAEREKHLEQKLVENLSLIRGISLKGYDSSRKRCPVISFVIDGKDSMVTSNRLNVEYNIALRAGFHCAYTAHKSIGTDAVGTIRVSPGIFNSVKDMDALSMAVKEIALQN